MKVNAPEKLYIISDKNEVILSLDNATDLQGDRYDFVDEEVFPFENGTFEYTRTDAFMKKAENFLETLGYGFIITDNITHKNYDKEQLIEDFRNYIKGE